MEKENNSNSFLWISLGIGVGMLITAVIAYNSIQEQRKRCEDPRIKETEALLEEAERLLRVARRSKPVTRIAV